MDYPNEQGGNGHRPPRYERTRYLDEHWPDEPPLRYSKPQDDGCFRALLRLVRAFDSRGVGPEGFARLEKALDEARRIVGS